jgi:hypothetical protein
MSISETLLAYLAACRGEHNSERSWEHCYRYFHTYHPDAIRADRDHAALQLGFYLASWGMYRPRSFLFHYSYTVHQSVVDCLVQPKFSALWEREFGASADDAGLVSLIVDACHDVWTAYLPFGQATETLLTKVILGTMGCFPALDTYFNAGYKHAGSGVPIRLNSAFMQEILRFCREHLDELQDEQARIEQTYGVRYPLMKLVDMYFYQIGLELEAATPKEKAAGSAST